MRIGRANGRLVIIDGDGVVDAATASGGQYSADPDRVFAVWDRFTEWAGGHAGPTTGERCRFQPRPRRRARQGRLLAAQCVGGSVLHL